VLNADSPKAILEALLPAVSALAASRPPQPPADSVRPELERATQAWVKALDDGFAKLRKSLETAFAKLEQAVLKAVPAPASGPAVDPGPVLAGLQAALARVSLHPAAPPQGLTAPLPAAQVPSVGSLPEQVGRQGGGLPSGPPVTAEQLRAVLRQAYDHLCLFAEFRDKMVEIPRLYHEAAQRLPGLSVERFHRELEALSAERKVELHKLNEVHTAKERQLAIEKDDRLYYYAYWK
jgi:hypothetical protein